MPFYPRYGSINIFCVQNKEPKLYPPTGTKTRIHALHLTHIMMLYAISGSKSHLLQFFFTVRTILLPLRSVCGSCSLFSEVTHSRSTSCVPLSSRFAYKARACKLATCVCASAVTTYTGVVPFFSFIPSLLRLL